MIQIENKFRTIYIVPFLIILTGSFGWIFRIDFRNDNANGSSYVIMKS